MKHMAELQLTVVGDVDTRNQLMNQINNWEENMERLHCEQFRLRCYMSSLQSGELPNPKVNNLSILQTFLNQNVQLTLKSFPACNTSQWNFNTKYYTVNIPYIYITQTEYDKLFVLYILVCILFFSFLL